MSMPVRFVLVFALVAYAAVLLFVLFIPSSSLPS